MKKSSLLQTALNRRQRQNQQGSGIIEVLIATLVVGMTLTSVAAVLTLSLKANGQNRLRAIAQTRAQEGVETFSRYRDELGWRAFSTQFPADTPTIYCLDPLPTSMAEFSTMAPGACTQGVQLVGTSFTRQVEVTPLGVSPTTAVGIRVTVSWEDGNQTKDVTLYQVLKDI